MSRAPHRNRRKAQTREIDAAFLLEAAERLALSQYTGIPAESWTDEVADAFLGDAQGVIEWMTRETDRLHTAANEGRRHFGPTSRALNGAAGTLEKALADPQGFDVERLQSALDTIRDYTEHVRVEMFAIKKLKHQRGRPRKDDSEEARRSAFIKRIRRAAGIKK